MKQYLFFDMDGVLVDFDKKLQAYLAQGHSKEVYKTEDGFYRDMEPMPGAIEAFRKLSEYYDCYILSAPSWSNASCYTDKRLWVEEHLGDLAVKKLILTHNKGMFKGRALIDDRTKYGVKEFTGEHIHFGTERFPDWESVLNHLIKTRTIEDETRVKITNETECARLIELSKHLEPVEVGGSLHIHEETYEIEGETYNFLYALSGNDSPPMIERVAVEKRTVTVAG